MQATFPGEFIHMIIMGLSTHNGEKSIIFISVDNCSRYCFSNVIRHPLSFEGLHEHLDGIIDKLSELRPGIKPTFIMGYGEPLQFELAHHYNGKAHFIFNKAEANRLARPVKKELLKHIMEQPPKS
jgi:hypothetical protein